MSTADLRREFAQLEAKIIELKDALVVAEHRRATVQQQLRQVATFPILTLPVEITAQIFTHSPLVFLTVCHRWRDIAFTTPALWSAFRLLFDTIRQFDNIRPHWPEPAQIESYIHQWLGRAGGHQPLSLTLGMEGYFVPALYKKFPLPRIRDIIHLYAPRIAYLELYCNPAQIRELALDTVAFPMLQHVCITSDDSDGSFPSSEPLEVFSDAPQLTQLTLEYLACPSSYVLPALQLTKFEGYLDNLEILTLAPNLIEATCRTTDPCRVPSSPITHARLRSLTLSGPQCHDRNMVMEPMDILPYLTLPELRTLDLSAYKTAANPASISEFVRRSGASLLTLVLVVNETHQEDGSEWVYDEWEACFRCLQDALEGLIVWPTKAFLS
ncbi:hypothetical protein FB45DRAFT_1042691 [Roridomyces roridus]|uniref:F-box domain-containing protein n=1 Tax=Roridomyces roridus TaxID=1738132 RepID=A0AAD7F9D6_9AGAR|nr:hypothetical protein FB45DRAFT_1042691 [Roridomyces roridus]